MLLVLCGVPGSGKTTLSNSLAELHGATLYTFDNLPGAFSLSRAETVRVQMWENIANDLQAGRSVVCDDLNTKTKWRSGMLKAVEGIECDKMLVAMDTPLEECLRRNASREHRLPDFVVKAIHDDYEPPDLSEGWDEIVEIKPHNIPLP